jgi:hemerythrin-like domain-containing protein
MIETNPIVKGLLTIHKVITRGLRTSIQKCDEYLVKQAIPPEEAAGFTIYLTSLRYIMHSHHLSEDDISFPIFRDLIEAPYNQLMDDHVKIASLLDTLDQQLSGLSFAGIGNLRTLIVEIESLWLPHIRIEEENFTSDRIDKVIEKEKQVKIVEKMSRHGIENSGPGPTSLPFLFYNLEGKEREDFMMHFPWIVKKILVPIIWKVKWKPMKPFLL